MVRDYGGPAFAHEEPGLVGTVAREHHVGLPLALVPGTRDRNHGNEVLLEELLRGYANPGGSNIDELTAVSLWQEWLVRNHQTTA